MSASEYVNEPTDVENRYHLETPLPLDDTVLPKC